MYLYSSSDYYYEIGILKWNHVSQVGFLLFKGSVAPLSPHKKKKKLNLVFKKIQK